MKAQPARIMPTEFEAYEAIILSGQMDAADVPRFIEENAEFAAWYKARMAMKPQRATD
jgi:hypothetical protein